MKVAGARVLITGASGGLGQAIARRLHAAGAVLVLSGRGGEKLTSLADELGATLIAADLSRGADVARLAEQAGEVDILVANAGLPATGDLLDLSQAQIDTLLEVNLRAPIALTRILAEGMAARGRGHVVFISSLSGKSASPLSSLYSATKFGLRGFAHGIRMDLRRSGVGVSVVLPGFVRDAGMFADTGVKLPPGVGTSSPEEVADGVLRAIRRNRMEVVIAPVGIRIGANIASVAPALSAFFQGIAGGPGIAAELTSEQAGKRPAGSA